MPSGIAAGQAWECEPAPPLGDYQRAKTARCSPPRRRREQPRLDTTSPAGGSSASVLGEAYQVADDNRDVDRARKKLGKAGWPRRGVGRPSAVTLWRRRRQASA